MASLAPDTPADSNDLHEIVAHSVLAGLCPLVPIPFLDDWLRDALRRRLIGRLAQARAVPLDADALTALANGYQPATAQGCVQGCLRSAITLPARFVFKLVFKKILRKLVIPLAIKDCVDTFSTGFHEAYLVRHGFRLGTVGATDRAAVLPLRYAAEQVRDEIDPRLVERFAGRAFRGSRRMLSTTARAISRRLMRRRRDGTLDADAAADEMWNEEPPLDGMVDELATEIGNEAGYLRDLERRLERRL
ncbi:MAG: hypothetical protein AAGE94_10930, partial [Acidobacteriota bacterium]